MDAAEPCPGAEQALPSVDSAAGPSKDEPVVSSLEASHGLVQTAVWIPVTLLLLWAGWCLGNKPHVARTLEINNAEPGNCAAGSTNWFLLLGVLLLNVGTLWE